MPDSTATTSNGMNACTVRVTMKNPGNLTDSGSYTASAVIGNYTSYGQASLHMTGADTVYAKASGTISGFNKVSSSTGFPPVKPCVPLSLTRWTLRSATPSFPSRAPETPWITSPSQPPSPAPWRQ